MSRQIFWACCPKISHGDRQKGAMLPSRVEKFAAALYNIVGNTSSHKNNKNFQDLSLPKGLPKSEKSRNVTEKEKKVELEFE